MPENLWHAALFEAVGVTVADVYVRDGVVGYVPYADKQGVYDRAWARYVPLLHDQWRPWIDGRGTLAGAVDAMIARLPAPSKAAAS